MQRNDEKVMLRSLEQIPTLAKYAEMEHDMLINDTNNSVQCQ